MFEWLKKVLPKRHKDDPVISNLTDAIVQESANLAEAETNLSKKVGHLRKEGRTMNQVLEEVVILVQSERHR